MRKALVVDDDRGIKRGVALALRSHGFEVLEAEDGVAALEKLEDDQFELILTDLVMPGADGLDVVRKARRRNPDALIILMTAHDSSERARGARPFVDQEILVKPFSLDTLEGRLQARQGSEPRAA